MRIHATRKRSKPRDPTISEHRQLFRMRGSHFAVTLAWQIYSNYFNGLYPSATLTHYIPSGWAQRYGICWCIVAGLLLLFNSIPASMPSDHFFCASVLCYWRKWLFFYLFLLYWLFIIYAVSATPASWTGASNEQRTKLDSLGDRVAFSPFRRMQDSLRSCLQVCFHAPVILRA